MAAFARKSDCTTDSTLLVAIVYYVCQHTERLDIWSDMNLPVGRETDILVHKLEKMIAPTESLLFLSKHCIEHNQCFLQPNVLQNRMPALPWVFNLNWNVVLPGYCFCQAQHWMKPSKLLHLQMAKLSCRPGFLPASVTALDNSLSFTQSSHRTLSPSQSSAVSICGHALFPTNSVSLTNPNTDVLFGFLITSLVLWVCFSLNVH